MVNKDEALKMAIELLEKDLLDIAIEMKDEVVSKSWSDLRMVKYYDQIVEYTKQTIQDCKEALEQPAWQGLTDDEMDKIFDETTFEKGIVFHRTLFKAIEQALRIKNENV